MFFTLCLFNIITGFVIFDYLDRMYGRLYSQKIYIGLFILYICLHLAVNLLHMAALNMAYDIAGINLLSYFLYKKYPKKFVYNLLFQLYLIFMDLITIPIFALFDSSSFRKVLESEVGMFASGIIGYVIVLCTHRRLTDKLKKITIDSVSIQQDIFFLVLAVFQVTITIYLGWLDMESAGYLLIFSTIGFLSLDFYIIYLFEIVSNHNKLEKEIALTEQQRMIMNRNLHDLELKYESSQKFIHDVRNYIVTLKGLHFECDQVLVDKYTNQLMEKLNTLTVRFQCGNRILNILINDKILLAKMKEIKINLDIQDVNWDFILEVDMTTLFGNLLDNAIEACYQIEEGDKYVTLRIAELNSYIVMNITNSCTSAELLMNGENYCSTKKGHDGFGLSNVTNVIHKYDGNIKIETHEDIFTVKIIIPIPEEIFHD